MDIDCENNAQSFIQSLLSITKSSILYKKENKNDDQMDLCLNKELLSNSSTDQLKILKKNLKETSEFMNDLNSFVDMQNELNASKLKIQ